jgi:hypothetical protein
MKRGWSRRSSGTFETLAGTSHERSNSVISFAERDGERLFVEAKGRTEAIGTDVDTMYGQILRRMPLAEDPTARFAVVVPTRAEKAALRVSSRVRALLGVEVFVVDDADAVTGPK